MCHRASDARAWQCDCGYEFGQSVDKVLELLREQRKYGRVVLGIVLGLDALMVAGIIYAAMHGIIVVSFFVFIGLLYWTFRSVQRLRITSESMRQLGPKTLPEARLLKD
jgi:hypothetical protein